MGRMHIGKFGAGCIDFGIDQTHMSPNNQAHLSIYPFYRMTFLNVTSKIHVKGGYYGQWLSSRYISALLPISVVASRPPSRRRNPELGSFKLWHFFFCTSSFILKCIQTQTPIWEGTAPVRVLLNMGSPHFPSPFNSNNNQTPLHLSLLALQGLHCNNNIQAIQGKPSSRASKLHSNSPNTQGSHLKTSRLSNRLSSPDSLPSSLSLRKRPDKHLLR